MRERRESGKRKRNNEKVSERRLREREKVREREESGKRKRNCEKVSEKGMREREKVRERRESGKRKRNNEKVSERRWREREKEREKRESTCYLFWRLVSDAAIHLSEARDGGTEGRRRRRKRTTESKTVGKKFLAKKLSAQGN